MGKKTQSYYISPKERLSSELEFSILSFFKKIIRLSTRLEKVKSILHAKTDFNLIKCFRLIDKFNNGYFTHEMLLTWIKQFYGDWIREDVESVFSFWKVDSDRITYLQYIGVMIPFDQGDEGPLSMIQLKSRQNSQMDLSDIKGKLQSFRKSEGKSVQKENRKIVRTKSFAKKEGSTVRSKISKTSERPQSSAQVSVMTVSSKAPSQISRNSSKPLGSRSNKYR